MHDDFIIIYRWEVHSSRADQFVSAWESLIGLYRQLYGAVGGRLHRTDDGQWLAYTQWPTRDQYLLAMERGIPDPRIAERMNDAVSKRLDPLFLSMESDMLGDNL